MLSLLQAIGGVGVFLLGMIVMTDGLKSLAGARVNHWLLSATRSPWSGALTGALGTAILQSSSATTVAAVGFVGAGLLEFTQALGIIFGANIGTTITGWLVALFGFKLKLGNILYPVIFAGVMLRIFSRGRWSQIGYALAGFGLIFIGIDLLQQAAVGQADLIRLDHWPADNLAGRLGLLLLGAVITVITQSSSAGVAAALVALNSGAIGFEQAAALVIGMDVGTTVTAAMATVGGSVGSRRTGFSHVIYNLLTAVIALILINPFVSAWQGFGSMAIGDNAEMALVAFHSSFNLIGVILVLPFSRQFARLIIHLIPDTRPHYARRLDPALLREADVALDAVEKIIVTEFLTLMIGINQILEKQYREIRADMWGIRQVLRETHDFLDQIHIGQATQPNAQRLTALIHALDHMQRLYERCDEDLDRAVVASTREELTEVETLMDIQIDQIIDALEAAQWEQARSLSEQSYLHIQAMEQPQRERIYQAVASGEIGFPYATQCAEALRWMTRVSQHISRICYYLARARRPAGH